MALELQKYSHISVLLVISKDKDCQTVNLFVDLSEMMFGGNRRFYTSVV